MRKIHSFREFNSIYEAEVAGPAQTQKSKLYDQTLGMILTTILNSYSSLVSYPQASYDSKIDADLSSVKSSPIGEKLAALIKIMEKVKNAAADNKSEGAQEAIDGWIAVGTKAGDALAAMINQYKDQPEEQKYINDFINSSIDNYLNDLEGAAKENPLKKDLAKKANESYYLEGDQIFEGIFQGKKGMIEDVSKQITLVLAKLAAFENTPGMADDVASLRNEVNQIAAQMGNLLDKKNSEIKKEDIKKASARLAEIPTLLDKASQAMLKQDTTNKEAASILVQALALVKAAKEKEMAYLAKKEEAAAKEMVSYSADKIKEVNPMVKKFQELVVDKFKDSKQISSLSVFKKMGTDGKYGPATKAMVEIMKSGFGLSDTSGETITGALIKELEKQEALKESRVYNFNQFSISLDEAFDTTKAMDTASKVAPAQPASKKFTYDPSKEAGPARMKLLFKKGDTGNAVVAINRIVGQKSDEKNYTDDTVSRVKDFQKLNGLYVDGVAGEDTLKGLYGTRDDASPKYKLNDEGAARGPWAYKTLADLLKEIYTKSSKKTEGTGTFKDEDLLGETSGLSSFINTILPAAKYAAFIPVVGLSTAIIGTTIDALKDRRNGVKGVVDALDGFVKESDLLYVLTILKALQGKKMADGKDAIQRFKELYKMDENGDDLLADVQSVGTKTFSVKGDLIKEEVLKLLGGK